MAYGPAAVVIAAVTTDDPVPPATWLADRFDHVVHVDIKRLS